MRCLFAVSLCFIQRASLTVNIDLSDVTNKYYTVLYRTVAVYEKKNRSLVFSGSRKNPNPRVHRSVGNSASLVSHWNGGPSGWDFSVPTEHQWWILFIRMQKCGCKTMGDFVKDDGCAYSADLGGIPILGQIIHCLVAPVIILAASL